MLTKPEELSANLNWRYRYLLVKTKRLSRSSIGSITVADAVQNSPRSTDHSRRKGLRTPRGNCIKCDMMFPDWPECLRRLVLASGLNPPSVANASEIGLGSEITVFRWATDRCDAKDFPDVASARPKRRKRRHKNSVLELEQSISKAGYFDDARSTGVCEQPSRAADRRIPTSTTIFPGWRRWLRTEKPFMRSFITNTTPTITPENARYRIYEQCWYNTITYARSDDGGQTFHQSSPPKVIAAPPFPQEEGQGQASWLFQPQQHHIPSGILVDVHLYLGLERSALWKLPVQVA